MPWVGSLSAHCLHSNGPLASSCHSYKYGFGFWNLLSSWDWNGLPLPTSKYCYKSGTTAVSLYSFSCADWISNECPTYDGQCNYPLKHIKHSRFKYSNTTWHAYDIHFIEYSIIIIIMRNQSEMLKYPGRISKWPTPIPTSACGKDALNALSIFSYPLRLVPKVNHFALEWLHCIKQQLHHRLPHCTPDPSDLYDHGLSYFRKKYGWIWRLQPIPQITTVNQLVVGPPAACQSLSFINQSYLRKNDNYWKKLPADLEQRNSAKHNQIAGVAHANHNRAKRRHATWNSNILME